jgi:hypothetical protein
LRGREVARAAQAVRNHDARTLAAARHPASGHYLLAWESLAERETKWNKFATDPEWLSKRSESERDGPIVASITNMFLQPTAFSAVK